MSDPMFDDGFPSSTRRSPRTPRTQAVPSSSSSTSSSSSWTTIPPLMKKLFDKFPLVTYPDTILPAAGCGSSADQKDKMGVVFVHDLSSVSIFPESVRLLTVLRLAKIYDSLTIFPASPHSAPENGPFPYVFVPRSLPKAQDRKKDQSYSLPSPQFNSWLSSLPNARSVPYSAAEDSPIIMLLDVRIRDAFLLTLYLYSANYKNIVLPGFYRHLNSSKAESKNLGSENTGFFPHVVSYVQYNAVKETLRRSVGSQRIDAKFKINILIGAEEALDALSDLVAESTSGFLSGTSEPGVVDAAVYGYLYPVLHLGLKGENGNGEAELVELVRERPNLVELVEKIHKLAWTS
ncbi:hypothetical protein BZA70DRAFT_274745 [Myxozyma melibiosi]|uniref:Metaxin glutathione S-transferase domain-containing protein n=1 Tax=Myxozyma melibiosi TaxID=54550 RepID=A0ABR1F9W2_9ASCO